MRKNVIWSSDINLADWAAFVEEEKAEGNIKDVNDGYEAVVELNNLFLESEKINLDIPTDGRILAIRENGEKSGYKILDEKNINAILESEGNVTEIEWYYDGHNIKATVQHNDGTRHYEYRELREEKDIKKLLTRIYQGKPVSRNMINYYTKSIAPQVKAVYGWA